MIEITGLLNERDAHVTKEKSGFVWGWNGKRGPFIFLVKSNGRLAFFLWNPFVTPCLIMQQRSRRCVMYRKRWVKCRLEVNTVIGRGSSTVPDVSTGDAVRGESAECLTLNPYASIHKLLSQLADPLKASWEASEVGLGGKHVCRGLNQRRKTHIYFCCTKKTKKKTSLDSCENQVLTIYQKSDTSVSHLP